MRWTPPDGAPAQSTSKDTPAFDHVGAVAGERIIKVEESRKTVNTGHSTDVVL
jgi:hypothetical protein